MKHWIIAANLGLGESMEEHRRECTNNGNISEERQICNNSWYELHCHIRNENYSTEALGGEMIETKFSFCASYAYGRGEAWKARRVINIVINVVKINLCRRVIKKSSTTLYLELCLFI